jgi:hypothetical protein
MTAGVVYRVHKCWLLIPVTNETNPVHANTLESLKIHFHRILPPTSTLTNNISLPLPTKILNVFFILKSVLHKFPTLSAFN